MLPGLSSPCTTIGKKEGKKRLSNTHIFMAIKKKIVALLLLLRCLGEEDRTWLLFFHPQETNKLCVPSILYSLIFENNNYPTHTDILESKIS